MLRFNMNFFICNKIILFEVLIPSAEQNLSSCYSTLLLDLFNILTFVYILFLEGKLQYQYTVCKKTLCSVHGQAFFLLGASLHVPLIAFKLDY